MGFFNFQELCLLRTFVSDVKIMFSTKSYKMKNLLNTIIGMSLLILLNSCANTYIHNSVSTPTFTDPTPAQINVGMGLRHTELNLAVSSKNQNIYGIANGYVGLKNLRPGQFFGD